MKISECETILNEVKFVKSHEEIIEKNRNIPNPFDSNINTPIKGPFNNNNFNSAYPTQNRSPIQISVTPEIVHNTNNFSINNFYGQSPFKIITVVLRIIVSGYIRTAYSPIR